MTTTLGGLTTTIGAGKVTNSMLAGSIDLTSKVTGTLPVANGGTGVATLTGYFDRSWATTPATLVPSTGIYNASSASFILEDARDLSKAMSTDGVTTNDEIALLFTGLTSAGVSATGASVTVKIAAPSTVGILTSLPMGGIGIGSTATATIAVSAAGSLTTPITIINPGLGYSVGRPPEVIVPLPDPIYENITNISLVNGFSGTIIGIGTTTGSGGNPLALKFTLEGPVGFPQLQTGYPIYIFDTRVGKGVTSINSSNSAVVGIGTTFVDNIYYIHQISSTSTRIF